MLPVSQIRFSLTFTECFEHSERHLNRVDTVKFASQQGRISQKSAGEVAKFRKKPARSLFRTDGITFHSIDCLRENH
jgi:hypothetical protein